MRRRGGLGRFAAGWLLCLAALSCAGETRNQNLTEVKRASAGALEVVLLSPTGALHHGRDTFFIEFRSVPGGALVDVGPVKATASMSMSGSPMLGSLDVMRSDTPGRYAATSDLSMAGAWRLTLEWNGASPGTVTFSGSVQ